MTTYRDEHDAVTDVVDEATPVEETPEPDKPSLWTRWLERRAERRERLVAMSDYEKWRRGLKIRRTIGIMLIFAIVGGIAYVIFGTNIGSQAVGFAQPLFGFIEEVRQDPEKAYIALGALLAGKIGLIFLIEDLFSPNSRR